jgi:hypothetical protein
MVISGHFCILSTDTMDDGEKSKSRADEAASRLHAMAIPTIAHQPTTHNSS